jgi:aarF domain-containing kinase
VKIQFPGIEKQFRSDLKTIQTFCSFALPQHVQPLSEIEKQFLTEFDYQLEAKNLERYF